MLTLVPSVIGLKQNLQKVTAKVYYCPVGPIQDSPGGRREVAQEGAPVIFVKNLRSAETPGRAKQRSLPARKGAARHVGRAEVRANSVS